MTQMEDEELFSFLLRDMKHYVLPLLLPTPEPWLSQLQQSSDGLLSLSTLPWLLGEILKEMRSLALLL